MTGFLLAIGYAVLAVLLARETGTAELEGPMSERLVSYLPTREVVHLETVFVYPPIPIRSCDWTAYDGNTLGADFDYEAGHFVATCPVGWGATEAEAIADFFDQLEAWA